MEKIGMPAPFQGVVAVEDLFEFGLYETLEGAVFGKSAQFILSHAYLSESVADSSIIRPTDSMPAASVCGVTVKL